MTNTDKNYKIFYVEKNEKGKDVFTTLQKFHADNDDKAFEFLKKFVKTASKDHKYYFGKVNQYVRTDRNGVKHEYDTFDDLLNADENDLSWIQKVKEDIIVWFRCKADVWYDVKFWFRDLFYWLKTKHSIKESWSLDSHMLDDLEYNVKILKTEKHGVPTEFCEKARAKIHKDEKDFDIKKSFEEHPNSDHEELKLAEELWNDELDKLLTSVKLYDYYDCGWVDLKTDEQKEFDKKWHHTLPFIKGTYNEMDIYRLGNMQAQQWNKIWDWMRKYGQNLWD